MSRNGDLLVQVAQQHHILKGDREADGEWKARLISLDVNLIFTKAIDTTTVFSYNR